MDMRRVQFVLLITVLMGVSAMAAPRPATRQACDVVADVIDSDPNGTNVRRAPGGPIIASLKDRGNGWIEAHIVAQQGDWYEVDRAIRIDPGLPRGGKIIFRGHGFMHHDLLGISGLQSGARAYAKPDEHSPPTGFHVRDNEAVRLLGCSGQFYAVLRKDGKGWTRNICTNMNTTCS
jgi:hypothetical protein